MSRWRPSSSPDIARSRAGLLDRARRYFAQRQVLAVDTPALSSFATSDPNIGNVTAQLTGEPMAFLHTSPESSMKCLLAAGYPDIYSICRVFRDGEKGRFHLPEFTLLEWYRLNYELMDIVADTTALIASCLEQPQLADQVDVLEYESAFREFAGLEVFQATLDDLANTVSADDSLRAAIGDDRNAWLDLVLTNVVATRFSTGRLTVLQHYPRSQAALARECPDDDRLADRFEVFFGSLELANGYVELTNAAEQRRRFEHDAKQRQIAGLATAQPDELLLAALQNGLPDCAGVALGVERLHMIYEQVDNIAKVVTFPARIADE